LNYTFARERRGQKEPEEVKRSLKAFYKKATSEA